MNIHTIYNTSHTFFTSHGNLLVSSSDTKILTHRVNNRSKCCSLKKLVKSIKYLVYLIQHSLGSRC